jgi:penicillin-binding protein 1A
MLISSIYIKDIIRLFFIAFVFSIAAFCGVISYVTHNKCIDFSHLEHYNPGKATILLDHEGREWARFALDRRKLIPLEQMPNHLIQAFLAAEDWDFYNHCGLSFRGIIRSMFVNICHGRVVQGASTITQQLVRLLFFDQKRTFKRKVKEQLMSLLVEMQFSKDQILETYLNHVYFGCGIYGVEAAAQRFWNKSVCDVTIDEAAVLAAIMRSPGSYTPLLHPLATQRQRNVVLGKMKKLQFITEDEFHDATFKPLELIEYQQDQFGLYARESIRQFLEELFGDALYTGGYIVKTTIDVELQKKAEVSFSHHIETIRKTINSAIDGALLTVAVGTGEIRALIGGYDYKTSKFNRALQAYRQLGSVFKTVIFASALQHGFSFADVECDEPITIVDAYGKEWQPKNYNRMFNGPITLAYALSHSNNIVVIKTFLKIGADPIVELAKKCRLPDPMHRYPSLSLGCIDVTLDQAVGMMNVFANNGVYVKPHMISWIKDQWGSKVYKHVAIREQVIEPHISGQVLKVLGIGLERVRAVIAPKKWIDSEAASKTGTTNDHRTCWFVGSTPELTTGVCIGCDDNRSMGDDVYPLHTAFPIWIGLHRELKTKKKRFSYDPSLKEVIIDEKSGKKVNDRNGKHVISIYV